MLGDRHQLDVCEAEVEHIGDQGVGDLIIAQEAAVAASPPGAEVDLIGGHGAAPGVARAAIGEMRLVIPVEAVGARHDRGSGWPQLRTRAERVGLQGQEFAVAADDLVLVDGPLADPRDEDFPQAAVDAPAHLGPAPIPGVEVAHHRHPPRVRGPHREVHALGPLVLHRMSAQPLVKAKVRALHQQVVVHLAEHRAKAIGIIEAPGAAVVAGEQAVGRRGLGATHQALEHPGDVAPLELREGPAVSVAGLQPVGVGSEGADHHTLGHDMGAKDGEGVAVQRTHDGLDLVLAQAPALGERGGQLFITGTFQISLAYSRMARSEENHPMWATFSIAERRQPAWSAQRRSTSRWAAP